MNREKEVECIRYIAKPLKNGNILLVLDNSREKERWAEEFLKEYQLECYTFFTHKKSVYCLDKYTQTFTKARCSKDDIFSEKVGRAIAIARDLDLEIPSFI